MLRLNLTAEPQWLTLLPAVEVFVDPPSSVTMLRARMGLADLPKDLDRPGVALALAKAVGRVVIRDWRGVLTDEGKPAPVDPDYIDALMDIFPAYEAFQQKFMLRLFALDQEKNGSAPSPTGTSAAAEPTAQAAPGVAQSARKRSTPRKR